MPTINQNTIESTVMGLPAHDWTHTNTVKAMTTIAATIVRRVSDEMRCECGCVRQLPSCHSRWFTHRRCGPPGATPLWKAPDVRIMPSTDQ